MTEHQRHVQVSFRRQVSDGRYGTEAAEVTLEDLVDDDEDASYAAEGLLLQAQRLVYGQLARSTNETVAAPFRSPAAKATLASGPVTVPSGPADDDWEPPF